MAEILPGIFKLIGASLKWCFYLGKKSYKDILKEEWNTRLGFFLIVIILVIIFDSPSIEK